MVPDTLLSNLDGCAEIERAAVPAPGAADVCHLPIISVGSYPDDTHSKIYLVNKCGRWKKMEINLVRPNAVTTSNRSQSADSTILRKLNRQRFSPTYEEHHA